MKLSKRLRAVADLVTVGSKVADIGCDHTYISIDLMQRKAVELVIALDVNEGPLQRAAENIRKFLATGKIETRLSDGVKALKVGEVDTLLIAGMGGGLMIRILDEGREIVAGCEELILQPQSEIAEVRRYLHRIGFSIREEDMVKDEGKYYVAIKAVHEAEPIYEREVYYLYGKYLLEKESPVLKQFLTLEREKKERVIQTLCGQRKEKAGMRLLELRKEALWMEEALSYKKMGM